MSEKIKKFLECDVEKVAGEPGSYWFTASTENRDRQGDVIVQDGWKLTNYKRNPVILWAHDYTQPPIGKAVDIKSDGKLRVKVQFVPSDMNPFAGQVERMVDAGFIKTVSVGFMAYKSEALSEEDKKQRPDMPYGRRLSGELLEVSLVPVPANPMALAERSFGELVMCGFKAATATDTVSLESNLLPTQKDGNLDPRLIRASMAALFGARGGVPIAEADRRGCFNHLASVAKSLGLDVPEFKTYTESELRASFADVWHDELLDVISAVDEQPQKQLISGKAKQALLIARKAIDDVLSASLVEEEVIEASNGSEEIKELITGIKSLTETMSK